jgi:serine/threonine-protein kinase HipA
MTAGPRPADGIEVIDVRVELPDGDEVRAGDLRLDRRGASRVATPTFQYDPAYLGRPTAYPLSPDLPLTRGPHRPAVGRSMLGAFGDAMPDDWGRRVIRRGGTRIASDLDYLVHVRDAHRQGAIRILVDGEPVASGDGPSLVDDDAALTRWMDAALAFETDRETDADVAELMRAGTSAGGARPKAVIEHPGGLRIVKFPRATELDNQLAWEAMALELARRSGIEVPSFWAPRLGERIGLMTERFDRTPDGHRIGYLSAHSLTQARADDVVDYTTLVEDMSEVSASPRRDAVELFRRIALTILLNNVDDHLRNHGFLRRPQGWALSPLFDVEPQRERGRIAGTPITRGGSGVDRDLRELVGAADAFSLRAPDAARIVGEVEMGTRDWGDVATGFGIHPDQLRVWAPVFDGRDRERAREIAATAAI